MAAKPFSLLFNLTAGKQVQYHNREENAQQLSKCCHLCGSPVISPRMLPHYSLAAHRPDPSGPKYQVDI